jgi:lactoylglutathione lyase
LSNRNGGNPLTVRIEHIALWTKDLKGMKEFYGRFFNGEAGPKYVNTKSGFESYFINFESGARLEIMKTPILLSAEDGETNYCGYHHFAFAVGSEAKVDELTDLLRKEGYQVISGPRRTGDGYYESCVLDPDGNRVEITV